MLSRSTFEPHEGTSFTLRHDEGEVPLELQDVKDLGGGQHDSFSLLFRAPGGEHLDQATYTLHHDEVGASDLFLVPIDKDDDGVYYEALFNRQSGGGGGER